MEGDGRRWMKKKGILTYMVNRRRGEEDKVDVSRRKEKNTRDKDGRRKKTTNVAYMVNRRARMVTTEYVFWGPRALAHGLPITP
jgi:hypothetical protein